MRLAVPLALVASIALPARAARADVQQWTELGVKHEVVDDVTVSFDQHLRFDEDVSRLGSFMPELGAQYRPKKWFRLGLGYRLQYERDGAGDMRSRHRFFGNVRARYDLRDVRLEYRVQFQDQLRPDDADERWREVLRNRLEVSYQGIRRWEPRASVELHHRLDPGELDKVWITAGATYSPKKRFDLEAFYRAELPQADPMEPTLHILGAAFHHDL
jgi:long-subunit fatty acid transport protein